jgi:hypothetical protein
MIKKVLVSILFIIAGSTNNYSQHASRPSGWKVEKESTLTVKGKSNVNRFSCNIDQYLENDTIIRLKSNPGSIQLAGSLSMHINNFNCHSSPITRDLRKTLKSTEFPIMIIRFVSIEKLPGFSKHEVISGLIEVELAGVVKRFELLYVFSKEVSGSIKLVGGRSFCFSDFSLMPPKKLAGIIRISDDFDVEFRLSLKEI